MVYKYLLANNYETIFEQGCKTTQAVNLGFLSIILQHQSIFLLVLEIFQVVVGTLRINLQCKIPMDAVLSETKYLYTYISSTTHYQEYDMLDCSLDTSYFI